MMVQVKKVVGNATEELVPKQEWGQWRLLECDNDLFRVILHERLLLHSRGLFYVHSIYSCRKWQKYHFFHLPISTFTIPMQAAPFLSSFFLKCHFRFGFCSKKPFYPRTCSKLCILPTFLKHQPRRNLVGIFKGEIILIWRHTFINQRMMADGTQNENIPPIHYSQNAWCHFRWFVPLS